MGGLIERAAELSVVGDALGRAAGGSGGAVLLSGPAGIGRSALLAHGAQTARDAGFGVLTSCPTPVSVGLGYSLVRDWLTPLVRGGQRDAPPFDGPAAWLADALAGPVPSLQAGSLATLDHALSWVVETLSSARPLLLVVDDLQWLDAGSLQLLDLLSARVRAAPVALVLALRRGEPLHRADVVDRIAAKATLVEPGPLTVAGVGRLRRQEEAPLGTTLLPDAELQRLTGGVPLLVHLLLNDSGGPAGAATPAAPTAPREVVEWLRERLARLGRVEGQVTRAAAVLGDDAHIDAVSALVGLSVAELADPLQRLAESDILAVDLWRVVPAHPILTHAALHCMTPSERSDLHRAAAAQLAERGAPARSRAEHLVHTLPGEDPAVVEVLASAGEEALESGTPEVAARLLLRAVAETRPEDTSSRLLARAATAHLHGGRSVEAFDLWDLAVDRSPGAAERSAVLTQVGDVRAALGQWQRAGEAYHDAAPSTTPASAEAATLDARRRLARAWCEGAAREPAEAGGTTPPRTDETHAERLRSALAAFQLAALGEDRGSAHDLALSALAGDRLLADEPFGGPGFCTTTSVLCWADAHADSLRALNAAVKSAHDQGSVPGIAVTSSWRGMVHFRQGRLRQALGDFQSALALRVHGWHDAVDPAVTGAALTHLALGQYDAALALEPALRAAAAPGHFFGALPLCTAGLVRASHGDHEQALRDYRRAARMLGTHRDNGSIVEWREFSVWSLRALRRHDEALAVAEEAVHHARRWGAPRGLGFALRALAQVTPRDRSVELLRESVGWFDESGSLDYRARAWTDLGRLLVSGTADERDEGVALLRRSLEYGRAGLVPSAAQRAARLLVRAGEQVSDPTADPAASLTTGERRVVELAAAGHTNRQIAHKLAVSVKAVEWHLSHAYRKLGVPSRNALAAVLYGETDPSSSSAM